MQCLVYLCTEAAVKKRRHAALIETQICDATVVPQNIHIPQDTSLLNETRVNLEDMIDFFCGKYSLEKPRTYRKVAHKEYLTFAESKKPSADMLYIASVYTLLSDFPGASSITPAHLNGLKHLFHDASKGHYNRDMAIIIRETAAYSVGSIHPSKSLIF